MRYERKKDTKKERKRSSTQAGLFHASQRNVCPIIKPLLKLNVLAFVEIDGIV